MSFFTDRITPTSEDAVRAQVIGNAQGAGLKISNWRIVSRGTQMLETVVGALFAYMNVVPALVRGFVSLDTSTDPGDVDPYDANNVNLTPAAGFLSEYGRNTFGVEREESDFAVGVATFVNAGPGSRTLSPQGLVFTWTGGSPPSPAPTYRNAADASVYTNPDGTVTVAAGASIDLPVVAEIEGSIASAPSSTLSLTTSLVGCTATNADPIVGNDREDRDAYIEKCRQAPARLSLGGPGDAYQFLATKNLDGTVLMNAATPPAPVGITRTQTVGNSSTGVVTTYYASGSGGAIADDVTAANRNIRLQAVAVMDAITFSGSAATTTSIHVAGTAKIRAKTGVTPALVAAGIVASLTANGKTIPIGGVDQTAGAGVVYTKDLEAYARAGYDGLYDVVVSTPAGSTTAIAVGHVPVLSSAAGDGLGSGDWVITVVS